MSEIYFLQKYIIGRVNPMTEEQKNKIRFYLHPIDGIEKTEEMIDSLEYLETNKMDEKVVTYVRWLEDKLEMADNDRNYYLEQAKMYLNESKVLKILLFLSLTINAIFIINKIL